MNESLAIAAILAACAVILRLRPQALSTLSKTPKKNPEPVLRAVRRIAGGGMALLAAAIAGGSWLLTRAGVAEATITAVRIFVLMVGAIGIIAAVEIRKNRKS